MHFPSFKEVYEQLITTSSISSTDPRWDEGNEKLVEKMSSWFSSLGFEVNIIPVAPHKYNLIAKLGSGAGGLLLSGHNDTVPFDEGRWTVDPHKLTEKNNRFYGLGTADMKGFFAFIIETVTQIDWQKQQKPLYVVATCDEETSMIGAQHLSEHAEFKPDACIIGEPTSLIPIHAHKGYVAKSVRITGKSGHSSNPSLGINAIEVMNDVLFALMQTRNHLMNTYQHPGFEVPYPTMNLGCIHGGDSVNRICGSCELHYDVRPLPGISLDSLDQLLQDALKEVNAKWPGLIEMTPLYDSVPGYECPVDHPFVQEISQICQTEAEAVNYCTEAPFLQTICPTVVMGPGSIAQAHQPDEYMSLDFVDPTISILKKSIQKYCF